MRIKLISPRMSKRPMDSDWKTRMSPPLALLTLAALTSPEHDVTIADENIERVRLDDSPDLVGVSVKADTFYRACEISNAYRRRGISVVFGGIHPTACPDECAPFADAIVVGEAEPLWADLLSDSAGGRLRRHYRAEKQVDIASVPGARWEMLAEKSYMFTNTLCISRGCPWRCDFCYNSSPNLDARYRIKPLANILSEIEALRTDHVMFIDDNFIGHPERTRELLHMMRPLRLTWHAAVSEDIGRRDELLDLMAQSGCRSLFIGFESVNGTNLLNCHKRQNVAARYDETIRKIHERGIMVNASVVFGFDGDGPGVFSDTVQWLERNRVATMTAHILTPYPGTTLYRRLAAEGRLIERDLRRYNTAHCVFRPARMTADELERGYRRAYREFYSWRSIARRMPAAASQRRAYLEFNLLYRKFGKATCWLGRAFGMRRLAKLARAFAYPQRTELAAPFAPARGCECGTPFR